jgi:CheY-like chemotaxis protein
VSNACKYTEPEGEIRISAAREGQLAVLRVRDSGIGLTPEALGRIFDLFYQVGQAMGRHEGGLGIGLTLASRLAQLHGGTITAASEGLGKGSEFTLRLPVQEPAANRPPASAQPQPLAQAAEGQPKHILVIDDNENVLATVKMLLESLGYRVSTAATGEAGVKRALSLRPDAALVDLGLPGLNGLQVAQRLRADLGGAIRLVALTGYSRESDIAEARAAGFDRHLVKSGDPGTLLRAMAEIFT